MELKKTPKADIENKRNIFFLVGLVLALSITLVAFEWTTKPKKAAGFGDIQIYEIEEELIPITREQAKLPPPPPPKVIEFLSIVDDDIIIDDELVIEDDDIDSRIFIDLALATIVRSNAEEEGEEAEIFSFAEIMPEFPGGELALRRYIANATTYPAAAEANGIRGKVYITFVVEKDGSVSNAVVSRSVHPLLDNEALRVINTLPRWKPGMRGNQPVRVLFSVPFDFAF